MDNDKQALVAAIKAAHAPLHRRHALAVVQGGNQYPEYHDDLATTAHRIAKAHYEALVEAERETRSFVEVIHWNTPNGEYVEVQYNPNGDWTVGDVVPAWQAPGTAPYNEVVEVQVGSMTFQARLLPDAAMSDMDTTCDQWAAENEGEHPPCWTDGCCWTSNENEDPSLPVTAWRPIRQRGSNQP